MSRLVQFALLGVAVVFLSSGCRAKPRGPKLAPVRGTVTLDGAPMQEGEISFVQPGEVPRVIEVRDGAFSGQAGEGMNKVEIRAYRLGDPPMMDGRPVGDPSRENFVPPQWNADSQLMAEVVRGGANDFRYDVTSK